MNDVTIRRPLTWASAGATDVGTIRPLNEDSFLCQPEIGLWTVADGYCLAGHDVFSHDIANSTRNNIRIAS